MKLLVYAVESFHTYIRQSRNIRQFNTSKTLSSYCYDRPWGKVLKVLNISASINVLSNAKCRFKIAFITARNDVWDKVIFSEACVKNSVRGWYPSMSCRYPGVVSRPTPSGEAEGSGQGVSRPRPRGVQAHTGGRAVYPRMHWGRPPPLWTATAAGSTHPTGMHSCFDKI